MMRDEIEEEEVEEFTDEKGIEADESREPAALLIGLYRGSVTKEMCDEYLNELASLAATFGVPVVSKVACPIRRYDSATILASGKLDEIKEEIRTKQPTLVIFDEEITPAQQRNLEKIFKVAVMDRTELILEIFAQRAQTKEAKLQIELAKTKYEFPRLKRLWGHFSRQRMSGGYLKGEGEKQIEIDRRLLKKKVEKLSKELKEVKKYRGTQRSARERSGIPTFAIIGYTNAGKSTLLNALTEARVFVEDKLFATLDPTTRKFILPNNQPILLTDTVGFIRKLPTALVAAFRSTLEAALQDDVLIHLIDLSHPLAEEQAETTYAVLEEMKVEKGAIITVLNKADLCDNPGKIHRLRLRYPKTVVISALHKTGFAELVKAMMEELAHRRQTVKVKIPQSLYSLVSQIRREGRVVYEEYEEDAVVLKAEVPVSLLHKLESFLIKN